MNNSPEHIASIHMKLTHGFPSETRQEAGRLMLHLQTENKRLREERNAALAEFTDYCAGPRKERDDALAEVERLRELADGNHKCWMATGKQLSAAFDERDEARDKVRQLKEDNNHWRVKAKCYGDMVHGCSPAFEAAGFPVDRRGDDGAVGGIARAAKAMAAEIERLQEEAKLTLQAATESTGDTYASVAEMMVNALRKERDEARGLAREYHQNQNCKIKHPPYPWLETE